MAQHGLAVTERRGGGVGCLRWGLLYLGRFLRRSGGRSLTTTPPEDEQNAAQYQSDENADADAGTDARFGSA